MKLRPHRKLARQGLPAPQARANRLVQNPENAKVSVASGGCLFEAVRQRRALP